MFYLSCQTTPHVFFFCRLIGCQCACSQGLYKAVNGLKEEREEKEGGEEGGEREETFVITS